MRNTELAMWVHDSFLQAAICGVILFFSFEYFRCELFDQNLKLALEVAEKAGPFGPGL